MGELKEFLINNWQLLASAVLFIIAVVVGLIQKHKKDIID